MRTSWIVIAAAVLGCSIGLGLTYYQVVSIDDRFEASLVDQAPEVSVPTSGNLGRAVVVGEDGFDFGSLERNQSGTCVFKVRNDSDSQLMIDLEGVSCGLCIKPELSRAMVQAGKEFEFKVNYTTHKEGPEFSEYVEMKTSDPNNLVIRFNITGYVTKLIRFSKREIALGNIAAGEAASTEFHIYGFGDEPIKILSQEFLTRSSADNFKLELTPLEADEFKEEQPRATSALHARLNLTEGRPMGPLNQILLIKAQLGDETTEAELSIDATIVSDITLFGGRGFTSDNSLLNIGSISSAVGRSATLRVLVRGPHRDDVKLTVGKIDPADILTASIGEPTVMKNGYLYALKITIPPGSQSVNRLGSQQSKIGRINIETTHPSAKQVPVYVSFAIE